MHRRGVLDMLGEVLEQPELARLRPVDVLEDDERRLCEPEALDQAPRGEKQQPGFLGAVLASETEDQAQVAGRVLGLVGGS